MTLPINQKFKCKRCGKCCADMGTVWLTGQHLLLKQILHIWPDDAFSDGGRCGMLIFENGKAVCLVHRHLGFKAKPEACQEYPEINEEPCKRQALKDSQ